MSALDVMFRLVGKHCVFETKVGLKYFGMIKVSLNNCTLQVSDFLSLGCDFNGFVVNPDFLRDEYSLAGTPILESCHYSLVDAIARGKDVLQTEYVKRCKQGILDARRPRRVRSRALLARYRRRMAELESGAKTTVYVVPVRSHGTEFFIVADGKHRLVMCAYHQLYANLYIAVLHPAVFYDPLIYALYQRSRKTPSLYTKNLRLLELIYGMD